MTMVRLAAVYIRPTPTPTYIPPFGWMLNEWMNEWMDEWMDDDEP